MLFLSLAICQYHLQKRLKVHLSHFHSRPSRPLMSLRPPPGSIDSISDLIAHFLNNINRYPISKRGEKSNKRLLGEERQIFLCNTKLLVITTMTSLFDLVDFSRITGKLDHRRYPLFSENRYIGWVIGITGLNGSFCVRKYLCQ